MGDLASSNRLAVVTDRLRRRFETYKHKQKHSFNRDACNSVRLYESQRQDTQLMHQKWLESRAKKAKSGRVSRETAPCSTTQVQPKMKRTKLDSSESRSVDVSNLSEQRQCDSTLPNQAKHSVSVNIEQIINTPQSTGSQIEIKLKSTVHTNKGNSSTTEISTCTNICKEEPKELRDTSNPSSNDSLSIGIDDVDELQEILDALEKEPDLIKELDPELKTEDSDILNDSKRNKSDGQTFEKDFCQTESGMFIENNSHLKSTREQSSGSNTGFNRGAGPVLPANQTQMPSFGDTGPAAKTLQQMAAQHQSHQDYIDKVNIGHGYGGDGFVGDRQNGPGYTPQQGQGYIAQHNRSGAYDYNQHMGNLPMYRGQSSLQESKMEPMNVLPYVADSVQTRPLSHFDGSSVGVSTPSNVQHSQQQKPLFTEAGETNSIQFSQSGKLNSTPNINMQFSQNQQVLINSSGVTGVPVSVTQSQSFSIGEVSRHNIPPNQSIHASNNQTDSGMSEQMKLQMYQKKIIQEQHIRSQMHNQRPGPPGPFPVQTSSEHFQNPNAVSTSLPSVNNPLETMQNMVEQTNQRQSASMYGAGKSGSIPGSAHLQNTSVSSSIHAPPTSQPQTVFPRTANNTNTGKIDNTGFTSTLMRGHRPPNVNVGPDGLNISQPRMNNWRQHAPHRPLESHQMVQCQSYNRHVTPAVQMYRMHMSQQQNMHMAATHHRQMQYINSGAHPVPRQTFMMNQQQHVQMVNGNQAMGNTQQASPSQGISGAHHGNPHFPDFMEGSHHSSDIFDSVHNANPSDYNFIDDILNGK